MGDEGGGEIADARLNLESRFGENLAQPAASLTLLVARFRIGVDPMAECDQPFALAVETFTRTCFGVHRDTLVAAEATLPLGPSEIGCKDPDHRQTGSTIDDDLGYVFDHIELVDDD